MEHINSVPAYHWYDIFTLQFGNDPKGLHLKHTQKGIKIVYKLVSHGLSVTFFELHSDQWN